MLGDVLIALSPIATGAATSPSPLLKALATVGGHHGGRRLAAYLLGRVLGRLVGVVAFWLLLELIGDPFGPTGRTWVAAWVQLAFGAYFLRKAIRWLRRGLSEHDPRRPPGVGDRSQQLWSGFQDVNLSSRGLPFDLAAAAVLAASPMGWAGELATALAFAVAANALILAIWCVKRSLGPRADALFAKAAAWLVPNFTGIMATLSFQVAGAMLGQGAVHLIALLQGRWPGA